MTFSRYLIWIAAILLFYCALQACQLPIRRKRVLWLRILVFIIKIVAAVGLAFLVIATDSILAWRAALPTTAFYAALVGDSASDLLTFWYVTKKEHPASHRVQMASSFLCVLAFSLYGTLNMQLVQANHLTIASEKILRPHRIVFVSDLHVGTAQSVETTIRTIEMIASKEPEAVLLGGDITDEFTTKEEMQKTCQMLGQLKAPVYFIFGNHDRQHEYARAGGRTYSEQDLYEALEQNGIHILEDEWELFCEDLVLFGRDDASDEGERLELSEIPPRPEEPFVLLVDHSPYLVEEIAASGADLQLSGHTHAGQLFPLQLLYNLAGYDAYGFYQHGDTRVYVSAGAGGWGAPFRTEAHSQFEVIDLEPLGEGHSSGKISEECND